jgi:uncharacterized protein DUF4440
MWRRKQLLALVGVAVVASMAAPATAAPRSSSPPSSDRKCAREFEATQRQDMESFRDFDIEAFKAVHDEDAITVFASGAVRIGLDAIMAALAPHFTERNAVWRWTEVHRHVDGCKTAFILYDTFYEVPSEGFVQHALTGVTYTRKHGRWLGIADQGTLLSVSP